MIEALPTPRPGWRVHLVLGRVSNLPTVWSNCLAGVILAAALSARPVPDPATLAVLIVALSLFYVGGMYLNDAFDHRWDQEHRSERPIPAGEIAPATVYLLGFAMMAAGEVLLALPGVWRAEYPYTTVLGGGAILGALITYYDYRHKRDPLSPVVMALCRVMIYLIAATAVAQGLVEAFSSFVVGGTLVLAAYLIGLTYVAKQENLNELRNLWPLVFLVVPFAYASPLFATWNWGVLYYLALLAWVIYALSFLMGRAERNVPRAVVSLIAGISLLDGLLIATLPGHALWALPTVAAFALTLFFQKYVPGT